VPVEKMNNIFKDKNIDTEVAILYRDIIITVMDTIFTTYLGDDITDAPNQKKHFTWAWENTKNKFAKEGYTISEDEELVGYFYDFISDVYYDNSDKGLAIEYNLKKLWYYLFNPVKEKSQSDIDVFVEIYDMFSKSIFK
jgi:hypothetical protein